MAESIRADQLPDGHDCLVVFETPAGNTEVKYTWMGKTLFGKPSRCWLSGSNILTTLGDDVMVFDLGENENYRKTRLNNETMKRTMYSFGTAERNKVEREQKR